MLASVLMALTLTQAIPEPLLKGIVDTPVTEVRPAFSPDGRCILWGAIGAGEGGWRILQTCRQGDGWSKAETVSFDSPENDFDPAFSTDGRIVYFFSNRPGGVGGDDLYAVERDPATGAFGTPHNLGPRINTAKDEWAPSPTADGKLIFSSDGWGGLGGQDLFEVSLQGSDAPSNLGAPVNTALDDFDAVLLPDGKTLVLTSGDLKSETNIKLFVAQKDSDGHFGPRSEMAAPFNCSAELNNGPAIDPQRPGQLFYSAYCPGIGPGRMDIFSAPFAP